MSSLLLLILSSSKPVADPSFILFLSQMGLPILVLKLPGRRYQVLEVSSQRAKSRAEAEAERATPSFPLFQYYLAPDGPYPKDQGLITLTGTLSSVCCCLPLEKPLRDLVLNDVPLPLSFPRAGSNLHVCSG